MPAASTAGGSNSCSWTRLCSALHAVARHLLAAACVTDAMVTTAKHPHWRSRNSCAANMGACMCFHSSCVVSWLLSRSFCMQQHTACTMFRQVPVRCAIAKLSLLPVCGLHAQAPVTGHLGSFGVDAARDVMGPPAGLRPLAVTAARNHRFYDVSPKAYNPAQVRTAHAEDHVTSSCWLTCSYSSMSSVAHLHTPITSLCSLYRMMSRLCVLPVPVAVCLPAGARAVCVTASRSTTGHWCSRLRLACRPAPETAAVAASCSCRGSQVSISSSTPGVACARQATAAAAAAAAAS